MSVKKPTKQHKNRDLAAELNLVFRELEGLHKYLEHLAGVLQARGIYPGPPPAHYTDVSF